MFMFVYALWLNYLLPNKSMMYFSCINLFGCFFLFKIVIAKNHLYQNSAIVLLKKKEVYADSPTYTSFFFTS